ncbi:MAG: copper resistance protein CopC [Candidatus Rokuibacteriota bacterium]|nr:MAG: copper resistance protein CopC [Candidatus Rokubacteria bacterium]
MTSSGCRPARSSPTTRRRPASANLDLAVSGERRRARRLGLALGAGVLWLSITPPAAAHAVLQRAEPRVDSTLKRAPEEIRLYFSERLEPAYSAVRVLNVQGMQVDRRDSRVDRANPALLRATLPALPPGAYTVRWRVLSIDADVTEGEFTFTVE